MATFPINHIFTLHCKQHKYKNLTQSIYFKECYGFPSLLAIFTQALFHEPHQHKNSTQMGATSSNTMASRNAYHIHSSSISYASPQNIYSNTRATYTSSMLPFSRRPLRAHASTTPLTIPQQILIITILTLACLYNFC